jgi:hypothetical protein
MYINGVEITTWSTNNRSNITLNSDSVVSRASVQHEIGSRSAIYSDCYLADVHLVDGQALDPTSFGEFSATTGVWVPKAYSGSYGTNGFRLTFADNASTTTIGYDAAGSNDWTANNLSVTAGAGNDSLVDVPTNGAETDTGAGGQVRGNYCTLNPLWTNSAFTLSNGNLDATTSSVSDRVCASTFGLSSGKWYWEITVNGGAGLGIGVCTSAVNLSSYLGGTSASRSYDWSANKYPGGASYGATYTTGDVIGVAVDVDAGTLVYYKNGASQGTAFSDLAGSTWFPAIGDNSSTGNVNVSANFGQRPFAYTAPSGFKALCTANLPAPLVTKASDVMDVVLYTGTGSALTPTSSLGFNPDLVWIKGRSGATDHALYDSVRGVEKRLESNTTDAEVTSDSGVTAFNTAGFSVGTLAQVNTSSATYAAWAWDAGSSTVTNTQGSISSQVRANASAGFSVVTYTGTGSAGATVGHGLGVAPQMIIVKNRDTAYAWQVYHSANTANPETDYLVLNTTAATADALDRWNDTAPTSTVFSLGGGVQVNTNTEDYVAYCWTGLVGYSSFGSYTGNGSSDGPFVYTGFRPRFLLLKCSSVGDAFQHWHMFDSVRNTYNQMNARLQANSSAAEDSFSVIDFTSNGFKLRYADAYFNQSGATYVWAAFAESPFAYSRAR